MVKSLKGLEKEKNCRKMVLHGWKWRQRNEKGRDLAQIKTRAYPFRQGKVVVKNVHSVGLAGFTFLLYYLLDTLHWASDLSC